MIEEREVGRLLIKRGKKTGPRTKPWGHLFEDGKDDKENYRYGLPNGNLGDKFVSIQQNKREEKNARLSQKLLQNPRIVLAPS